RIRTRIAVTIACTARIRWKNVLLFLFQLVSKLKPFHPHTIHCPIGGQKAMLFIQSNETRLLKRLSFMPRGSCKMEQRSSPIVVYWMVCIKNSSLSLHNE